MLFLVLLISLVLSVAALSGPKSVLIVQNKGGGHGEIGFSLAKLLKSANHKVTILQDACDRNAQPFSAYSELTGVSIVDTKLKDVAALGTYLDSCSHFDAVVDNNTKDVAAAELIANACKRWGSETQYLYVSSGGVYKGSTPEGGFKETAAELKDDNDCRVIEKFLASSGVSHTSFRPQYIYGFNTNKRINVDWFVDRIARDRVVPIPGNGEQFVALSHVDDVSAIIAAAIGNKNAANEIFNCGTDKFISYKGLCEAIATSLKKNPKDLKYVSYDPKKIEKKTTFPFRPSTFTVNPEKAKSALGWTGAKHTIESDLPIWLGQYKALGLDTKAFDTAEDDAIINASA